MMRSISFLRQKPGSFADALACYRRGQFSDAAALLCEAGDPSSIALLARTFIRQQRPDHALALLEHVALADLRDVHAGELFAIRASAKLRLRDFDGGVADLDSARVYGLSSNVVALHSEIEYVSSTLCYAQGDLSGASSAAERALTTERISESWMRSEEPADFPHSVQISESRALEMLGFVAAGRLDHREQIDFMYRANRRFDEAPAGDTFVEASLIHNYALIAKELDRLADAEYIERKVATIRWVESTRTFEFYTRHALGWFKASAGDYLGALREFRLAAQVAPSVPLRILAITDRAYLARELDESFSAHESLENAVELSREIDWESKTGEERFALFMLAEQLAPHATPAARQLLDLYFGLKTPLAVLAAGNHDRRLRGYECLATAAVLEAEGNAHRAIINLLEAFNIFDAMKFSLRAGRIALTLAGLTGEPKYRSYVERVVADRPKSWLMRRWQRMVSAAAS